MTTEQDVDDFLAHYGVKGMQWGVRRENRIQSLERVGSGTASKGEKARYALTEATSAGIRRNGGLAGSAANKAANMRAVDARVRSGKGSVADILKQHGGDRVIDTGRVDKDILKARTLVARPGTSSVTVKVVKDFNTLSDKEFFAKYSGTKQGYARRFDKHDGDPYMNAPAAKLGKVLARTMPQPKRIKRAGGYDR